MSSFEMSTVDDGDVSMGRITEDGLLAFSVTCYVAPDTDNDNETTPEQLVTARVNLTRGDILALTRALLAQLQDME